MRHFDGSTCRIVSTQGNRRRFANGSKCLKPGRESKCGCVAPLGEHLLCKHAFISPKSLNRLLLNVKTPLLVGLLNGLQTVKYALSQVCRKHADKSDSIESSERYRKNGPGLLFCNRGNDW
jgi:hypothetical protein